MAITSGNKKKILIQFKSAQFRYAITYVFITFFVLLLLNIYSSKVSQKLFYNSKEASMIEKCQLTATEVGNLEIMNKYTVADAVNNLGSLKVGRLIITDRNGLCIYDSVDRDNEQSKYMLMPEIVEALRGKGYDAFSWSYHAGAMYSRSATPIISYGTLVGCVYMMEYDFQQGRLIETLQKNTLYITLTLEIALTVFALIFSQAFTKRLRKIMVSMRIIRQGDYSHKVDMGGNDELTVLGQEFNDLVERLQTSEQKRNQFVSDASHELKTPLASIKLLSDSILQNDMDMDTVREFVRDIGSEADRLNRMSMKLLSLTKSESDTGDEYEIMNIAPTVERVIRMLSRIAAKHQIRITTDLAEDTPILVMEDDLYQIIFNLVENGIKYNVTGGSLHVGLTRRQDNAVLTVSDKGVGIPQEALKHIFERFYRVDKARARKSGGSGLGLAIVRNMVERNRGDIAVESREGEGTTFTVTFPIFDTEEEDGQ